MIILMFFIVSTVALFFMKAILWTLFQWGAKIAIPVALILSSIYIWGFFLAKSKGRLDISKTAIAWIWSIGFIELLFLGGLYHLTPQFFPSVIGNFFFEWVAHIIITAKGFRAEKFFSVCCLKLLLPMQEWWWSNILLSKILHRRIQVLEESVSYNTG